MTLLAIWLLASATHDVVHRKQTWLLLSLVVVAANVSRDQALLVSRPQAKASADEFDIETIGRITRYTVRDPEDPATTIEPGTRVTLVGEDAVSGIPICATSHGIGRMLFELVALRWRSFWPQMRRPN